MAPKGLKGKAAKPLFDKVAGSICGMQYTLYENGVLLREFAATLRVGQVVAVHAARADQNMEGSYWLARLCGDAHEAIADDIHSSDQIQEGWWVVKSQWYQLEQVSHRGYRLLPAEFPLVVNHIIRIPHVQFDHIRVRRSSTSAQSLSFLSEQKHNMPSSLVWLRLGMRLGSGIQLEYVRMLLVY